MRTLATVMVPPPIGEAQSAGAFLRPALELLPNAVAIGWIPALQPEDLSTARHALLAAGLDGVEVDARLKHVLTEAPPLLHHPRPRADDRQHGGAWVWMSAGFQTGGRLFNELNGHATSQPPSQPS